MELVIRENHFGDKLKLAPQEYIGCTYEYCDFEDLTDIIFTYCSFCSCRFKNLEKVRFYSCFIAENPTEFNGDFTHCNFSNTRFTELEFYNRRFSECSFWNSDIWAMFALENNHFDRCAFQGVAFKENATLRIKDNNFENCEGLEEIAILHNRAPQGAFEAWKAVYKKPFAESYYLHLQIPAEAKRVSFGGPKIRVSEATVLGAYDEDGQPVEDTDFISAWDPKFHYKVGEQVFPDEFDPSPYTTCTNGIHCFLTFEQAREY